MLSGIFSRVDKRPLQLYHSVAAQLQSLPEGDGVVHYGDYSEIHLDKVELDSPRGPVATSHAAYVCPKQHRGGMLCLELLDGMPGRRWVNLFDFPVDRELGRDHHTVCEIRLEQDEEGRYQKPSATNVRVEDGRVVPLAPGWEGNLKKFSAFAGLLRTIACKPNGPVAIAEDISLSPEQLGPLSELFEGGVTVQAGSHLDSSPGADEWLCIINDHAPGYRGVEHFERTPASWFSGPEFRHTHVSFHDGELWAAQARSTPIKP